MRQTLTFNIPTALNPFTHNTSRTSRVKIREFASLLSKLAGQGLQRVGANQSVTRPTLIGSTAAAGATVTLATVLAGDTLTLNGQALTAANGSPTAEQFDMSGTDIADATSLVNAINNTSTAARIAGALKASNRQVTITLATTVAGDSVTIDSTRLTACPEATDSAGVRLAAAQVDRWCMSGDDTADAVSLVLCINAHPVLRQRFFASSAAGVVSLFERPPAPTAAPSVSKSGAAITLGPTTGLFTATAIVFIEAVVSGAVGNCMTIASSSATLAIGGSATRLTGGADFTTITL